MGGQLDELLASPAGRCRICILYLGSSVHIIIEMWAVVKHFTVILGTLCTIRNYICKISMIL